MASGEAAMPMQTVVLKVSIHCHGCKKKVRKVLKSIEGVQDVKVDAGQHKVTVTGTVDADTLVKRLYKSGKQALLLQPHAVPAPKKPEPAPAAEAPKKPEPAPAAEAPPAAAAQGDGGKEAPPPAAAAEPVKESQAEKAPEKKQEASPASEKKPEQEAAQASEKKLEAESKKEDAAKPSVEAKSVEAAAPKAKAHEPAAKEEAGGNDAAKKSKKPVDAGEAQRSVPVVTAERTLSAPPPKHMYYEEYDHYRYPPQPILSYHAAQPRPSVSYYAPQPQTAYSMHQEPPPAGYPAQQHQPPAGYPEQQYQPPPPRRAYSMEPPEQKQWSPSYLYMPYPHSAPDSYYQDYYSPPGSHAPPPPLHDSYRMFDDENPNACSVM